MALRFGVIIAASVAPYIGPLTFKYKPSAVSAAMEVTAEVGGNSGPTEGDKGSTPLHVGAVRSNVQDCQDPIEDPRKREVPGK